MLLSSKKLLDDNCFQNLISKKKKIIFIFVARRLIPFKGDTAPGTVFFKNTAFFEKIAK